MKPYSRNNAKLFPRNRRKYNSIPRKNNCASFKVGNPTSEWELFGVVPIYVIQKRLSKNRINGLITDTFNVYYHMKG